MRIGLVIKKNVKLRVVIPICGDELEPDHDVVVEREGAVVDKWSGLWGRGDSYEC